MKGAIYLHRSIYKAQKRVFHGVQINERQICHINNAENNREEYRHKHGDTAQQCLTRGLNYSFSSLMYPLYFPKFQLRSTHTLVSPKIMLPNYAPFFQFTNPKVSSRRVKSPNSKSNGSRLQNKELARLIDLLEGFDPIGAICKPVLLSSNDMQVSSCCNNHKNGTIGYRTYKKLGYWQNKSFYPNDQYESSAMSQCYMVPWQMDMINMKYFPENHLSVLQCSSVQGTSETQIDNSKKTSEEQLIKIMNQLSQDMTGFFKNKVNLNIYSQNIVCENRIRGIRTEGLAQYAMQMASLRIVAYVKYSQTKLRILKITCHPEDNTIKMRWSIIGRGGFIYTLKGNPENTWYDGFSTFYVGSDGLIYLHEADKMMPDEEREMVKKMSLATSLALLLGLRPKEAAGTSLSSLHIPKEKIPNKINFGYS